MILPARSMISCVSSRILPVLSSSVQNRHAQPLPRRLLLLINTHRTKTAIKKEDDSSPMSNSLKIGISMARQPEEKQEPEVEHRWGISMGF